MRESPSSRGIRERNLRRFCEMPRYFSQEKVVGEGKEELEWQIVFASPVAPFETRSDCLSPRTRLGFSLVAAKYHIRG